MSLERAGICTVEQLIECPSEKLPEIIHRGSDLAKLMAVREELTSQI